MKTTTKTQMKPSNRTIANRLVKRFKALRLRADELEKTARAASDRGSIAQSSKKAQAIMIEVASDMGLISLINDWIGEDFSLTGQDQNAEVVSPLAKLDKDVVAFMAEDAGFSRRVVRPSVLRGLSRHELIRGDGYIEPTTPRFAD